MTEDERIEMLYATDKPMTNADRIRAMTDEELARFIWQPDALMIYMRKKLKTPPYIRYNEEQVLDWLKQEAADKDGEA